MLYDGCVGVATCRGLLFTSADNYRHLVFNYPRIIARRPRRLRTAAVMDREHGVNIVITLRRHSASSTLLGWSPLLTSARSSCVMCPSYDAPAAINETTFKIWNSWANFTVYIVFVICPKLDHFLFKSRNILQNIFPNFLWKLKPVVKNWGVQLAFLKNQGVQLHLCTL